MGADKFSESEWKTRKTRIEPKLRSAGWDVVPFDAKKTLADYHCCAIEEYPTSAGPADYALCFDGHILGVIEAKRLSLGPQNVLTQAERYSRGASSNPLNFNGYHVPFLYSTNGEIIWHDDVRHPKHRSRRIVLFHTPDALRERLAYNFEATCAELQQTRNDHPRLRPYQIEANEAVEQIGIVKIPILQT